MNTPIRKHSASGTPADSKRNNVAPVEDISVRNVRPKWDKKMSALDHLLEDEQNEGRFRTFNKCASAASAARLNLIMDRQREPDPTALLDAVIAKTEILRKDLASLGEMDMLLSDEAKFIPLVSETLMNMCDHAKQSTGELKNDKEVEDLRRELHELSRQRSSDVKDMEDLRNERDSLRTERNELLSREECRPQDDYHALYLEEHQRAIELSKECNALRSEVRELKDDDHSLYSNELRSATELKENCK